MSRKIKNASWSLSWMKYPNLEWNALEIESPEAILHSDLGTKLKKT